ncbi:hypothetical protein LY76DRAFT_651806 [Colletotrichum caudatum]|nr:hypothetical protein LY76DRAFT_651806 [Colletotrichum caudatum]
MRPSSLHWVEYFLQIANPSLTEDSIDPLFDGEPESDLLSLFETENVTSEEEYPETLSSESDLGAALDDSDEYVLGQSSDSYEDDDEDDEPTEDR